jgi:hypothetical protein
MELFTTSSNLSGTYTYLNIEVVREIEMSDRTNLTARF